MAETSAPSAPAPAAIVSDSQFASGEPSDNVSQESQPSQELNSEAAIDAAAKSGDLTKQQAKDLKKKFQLKVDGVSEELELDMGNEDEVRKYLQKARSFDKRAGEFTGFKKQVDQFINELKSAPDSVLERLGINVDEFAEKRIQRKIEEMSKSPEQIEREKMQSELESLRREKEESAKARETAEQEAIMNKTAAEIESSILKAMDKSNTILPKNNPEVIGMIARAMKEAMVRGYEQVSVEDVVPIVEKRYRQQLSSMFDVLPEEALEAVIGKNNLDRLRKKRIAKAAPASSKNVGTDTGESILSKQKEQEASSKNKKSYRDFFRS